LDGGRSEQKVTTLDKDLARNISAKYGSNPSSGSWEEVCFTYFPLGRYVNLCPPLVVILDFQSVQKVTTLVSSLQWSFMTIFNSILHVVSEKKIFEISANQRLLWPLAAILDNQSEQKVTTIDQNLVRNISAKNGSNPSGGSWEEVCFTYFP
jgi:hypothetical protein